VDRAGLDDDHIDTERPQFHPEAVAQSFHRELGRVVPAAERLIDLAADGRDVDDAPTALAAHMRQHQLDETGQAEQVDLELVAGLAERDILHRAV